MTLFLTLLIIMLATVGQAIMGFGGGLISIPLLSLLMEVKDAVMLGLVLQVLVGLLAFKERRELPWKLMLPMLLTLLPATWLGTYLLGAVPDSILRRCLAAFILLFLAKSLFAEGLRLVPSAHWSWGGLAGGLSGVLQGMIGTGGPPLVIYLDEAAKDKDQMRLALLVLLTLSNVLRVLLAIPWSPGQPALFHKGLWLPMAASIPCIFLAMWIGQKLHAKVDEAMYRKAMLLLLLGSSISLLLKS